LCIVTGILFIVNCAVCQVVLLDFGHSMSQN